MTQDANSPIHFTAEEGKTFVSKADGSIMGVDIWLGVDDTIDNYDEVVAEVSEDL